MAFPQGIDFRATSGFVTDPTGCDYEIYSASSAANYPRTTAQGNTVGWETLSNLLTRNRNAGIDARLAGTSFNNTAGAVGQYRIDLPSTGAYNVGLAAGDATYLQPVQVELFDTTSSLGVLSSGVTSGGGKFKDATNTEYSSAAWPGSNTRVAKTFSTTICRFKLGTGSVTIDVIAHFYIESGAAADTFFGQACL